MYEGFIEEQALMQNDKNWIQLKVIKINSKLFFKSNYSSRQAFLQRRQSVTDLASNNNQSLIYYFFNYNFEF